MLARMKAKSIELKSVIEKILLMISVWVMYPAMAFAQGDDGGLIAKIVGEGIIKNGITSFFVVVTFIYFIKEARNFFSGKEGVVVSVIQFLVMIVITVWWDDFIVWIVSNSFTL